MIPKPISGHELVQRSQTAAGWWGLPVCQLVLSQLGYPPIPEGQPRHPGRGGWIPAGVPVEVAAHPVWWLEDGARLRRRGEDDDDYAGRVNWDLEGRGLLSDRGVVDVLAGFFRLSGSEGDRRVEEWLAGGADRELSGFVLPANPNGPVWAVRETAAIRPRLETELDGLVAEENGVLASRVADARSRFKGSNSEGVVEVLVDAVDRFLDTGRLEDRRAVGEGAEKVRESVLAAHRYLGVLLEPVGRQPLPIPREWPEQIAEAVGRFYAQPDRVAGDQLIRLCSAQAEAVCDAGNAAAAGLEEWHPPARRRSRALRPVSRLVTDIAGPPPVRLTARELRKVR